MNGRFANLKENEPMATHNQNQPSERKNGGAASGVRPQIHDAGERIQQGASGVGEQVHEGYGAAREELANRYRQAEGLVARNPGQSVLMGFGLGFGLGVLLTVLMSRREESSWYERHIPDSLRDIPERFRHGAEALARHIPGR